jgi:hypothetical protein
MTFALVGILGACIGALLNAGWNYALARRAERRELRTAARLLLPELLQNREHLDTAFKTGSWGHVRFETDRWKRHEVLFMSSLEDEWVELTKVYTAFTLLNADRKIRDQEQRHAFDEGDDFDYFELTLKAADESLVVLRKVAELPPGETLRIQEYFWV